jgi:hypothetical protein
MRTILAATLLASLAGCPNPTGSECEIDNDCGGGDVCARDHMCTAEDAVRAVTATWTIRGADANATTCGTHPDLYISFIGNDFGDTLGFAPVPCKLGQFSVDKLPVRFKQVELGVDGGTSDVRALNAAGTAALDLRL